MSEAKQYVERDLMALDKAGNHYCRHVSAMTREGLHSKSDIAAELGWRDMQIDQLKQQVQQLDALAAENALMLSDYRDIPEMRRIGMPITPATDAWLNEVRAQGVEMWVSQLKGVTGWTVKDAEKFAAKLRSGEVSNG